MQPPIFFDYLSENSSTRQQKSAEPMDTFCHASSSGSFSHTDEDDKMQLSGVAPKTSVDFKRKKNWPERILVEITGLLHVLSPYGTLLYCSESAFELTGYRPHELVGQRLVEFLHVDDMDIFIKDFQMSFHNQSQITTYYRFRKKDETYILFEVVGRPGSRSASQRPDAFYGIAQPIPSKNGSSLDSFLEVKAENEWLKSRIDELSERYGRPTINHVESDIQQQLEITSISETYNTNSYLVSASQNNSRDLVEEQKPWLDYHKPDMEDMMEDIKDTHTSEELMDRKDRCKRRKKNKEADEFVCKDCGTTTSPEWRKGPQGPKTLCNACGLRWAKRNRKNGIVDH